MTQSLGTLAFLTNEDIEKMQGWLSKDSYKTLRKKIGELQRSKPNGSGMNLQILQPSFNTIKAANSHLQVVMQHLDYHRKLSFMMNILRTETDRQNRLLQKKNKKLEETNQDQREEIVRLKLTMRTLLGIKEKKKTSIVNTKTTENHSPESSDQVDCKREPKKRGAPKGHRGNTRTIPDKIDKIEEIQPTKECPNCKREDIVCTEKYDSKYVEDIEIIVHTTEKKYYRGECKSCGHISRSPEAIIGPPVSVGNNISVLLSTMRQTMGVSYRKLSAFCTKSFNIKLSPPGVLGVINRSSDALKGIYIGLGEHLRNQTVIHGDETGWKMDGERWQLWCFCNKDIAYFHGDKSRGRSVIKGILGTGFKGLVHCDFYAAYNYLENLQRCLIHLQRDIKKELIVAPMDKRLVAVDRGLKNLITEGVKIQKEELSVENKKIKIAVLESQLDKLAHMKARRKVTKKFIKRLRIHKDSILKFIEYPEAEYHNNRAERQLRPAVIFRKISFGNRTPEGVNRHSILSTIVQTCLLKNIDVKDFFLQVLRAPPREQGQLIKLLTD